METMLTDDSELTMDIDMEMETEMEETVEPSFQKRRNTWPGSLQRPEAEGEGATGNSIATDVVDEDISPPTSRKPSMRRNAWGNMSYAEMIATAIESAPERRMTLAQIYDWIVKNVPYFQDKGDNSSSASWKNSVRHNLSLHSQFTKLQNEGTSKSSWWVVKPDAAMQRRRARTMESGTFDRRRGKGRLKTPGTGTTPSGDDITQPGSRCRSNSFANSRGGRLSPIQSEAEPGIEWSPDPVPAAAPSSQFIISGSQQPRIVSAATTRFPVSEATKTHFPVVSSATNWQNFTMTLSDPTPLVATSSPLSSSGQTTVLFVEQGVQVSTIPESRCTISQAPVIVLLAAPQTATVPQYLPSTSVGVIPPTSTQPNISCVTFGRLEAISGANLAKKPILPSVSVAPPKTAAALPPAQVSNAGSGDPAKSKSVSESYLQVLRFLTSRNVRAYMKSRPDFKEKLCEFLLAKKAKMLEESSERLPHHPPQQQQRRILPALMRDDDRPGKAEEPADENRRRGPDRSRLEDILGSISLNRESSVNFPQSSNMPDVRSDRSMLEEILNAIALTGKPSTGFPASSSGVLQQTSPMQLADIDQDIIALEPDFLLDFNLDTLTGDLNCDDDFLNQF